MEYDLDHPFDLFKFISFDSEKMMRISENHFKSWPAKKRMTEQGVCYQMDLLDARRFFLDDFLFMPYFQYDPPEIDDPMSVVPNYTTFVVNDVLYIGMNDNDFFDKEMEKLKPNESYLVKIAPSKQKRVKGSDCLTDIEFQKRNISQEMCYSDCEQRVYGPRCWNFTHLGYSFGTITYANTTVPWWLALTHDSIDPSTWTRCQNLERPNYKKCADRNCKPQCDEWIYESTVLMVNNGRLMSHTEEATITVVFSYQIKSGTQVVEEKPTYTWHTFLSNVGGHMGLWLGMSMLSISQFVFFVFRWVEYRLQMRAEEAIHNQQMRQFQERQRIRSKSQISTRTAQNSENKQ